MVGLAVAAVAAVVAGDSVGSGLLSGRLTFCLCLGGYQRVAAIGGPGPGTLLFLFFVLLRDAPV